MEIEFQSSVYVQTVAQKELIWWLKLANWDYNMIEIPKNTSKYVIIMIDPRKKFKPSLRSALQFEVEVLASKLFEALKVEFLWKL